MVSRTELESLAARIEAAADEQGLPVVVSITVDGEVVAAVERGWADRAAGERNTIDTVFATASVTKGVTALVVMSLVAEGRLGLATPVRRWLGDDLPLVDDAVTVDHLLTHRSGIGDYLDESTLEDDNAYVMPIPVHLLASVESYLEVLAGYPQVTSPGREFAYNNSGYVVLALVAERVAGQSFDELVAARVLDPAGMTNSGFHRTDEPAEGVANGYLELVGPRTNIFHLPVLGGGDGGLFSTVTDLDRLWRTLFTGRIVPPELVNRMVEPITRRPTGNHYGRGLWLVPDSSCVALVGGDAGISVRTVHDPTSVVTVTAISNSTSGAWPVAWMADEVLIGSDG
jgi:CubicO group peptidase (beta-lactamase class C family)